MTRCFLFGPHDTTMEVPLVVFYVVSNQRLYHMGQKDNKIWSSVQWDSDLIRTALARPSSNSKLQTRHFVREGAPHQETRNCQTENKIWSWAPDGSPTPRQIGRLTVGRKFNFNFNFKQGQTCLMQVSVLYIYIYIWQALSHVITRKM
jgi:hypothetical protein